MVRGTISSAGFASGDRFVVGHWPESPIGPMGDIMWARPDGRRILLAPSDEVAAFVGMIYEFDEIRIDPLRTSSDGRVTTVEGHGLSLRLEGGQRRPVPFPRPLAMTRWIERPIARALMQVETYGTSAKGATEWYQTRGWRWIAEGRASLDGKDLGRMGPIDPPVNVGFSEPPSRPSIVDVRVTIDLPRAVAAPTADSL